MEVPMNPIFACSGCHKKFYADGFKVTRLGLRLKTCLECNARYALKQDRIRAGTSNKEHGNENLVEEDKRAPIQCTGC